MVRTRALGLFLAVSLLFGTAFPVIEVGLASLPPLGFAASRYALSAALLLTYARVDRAYWRPRTRRDAAAVFAGGVLFIGGTGLTFVGQQYTTAGTAAILVSLTPVLTAVIGWALLPEERLSRRGVLGVLVGLAGVALVVSPDPANLVDPSFVGKVFVLGAAVLVTLGTVLVRRSRAGMPVVPLVGWAMLVGAAVLFLASLAAGESLGAARPTTAALLAVVYLGVVAGAVAFVGYFTLLERVGALEANLVTYVVPVVAVTVGRVFLGEDVSAVALAGFATIAVGFGLLKNREVAAEVARFRGAGR